MAYKIRYQKRYLNKFENLIIYLREQWSDTIAAEVVASINVKIAQISINPYLGSLQGRAKVRSIIITKHQRLYYRIERNMIAIVNLIDMRIDPKRNPYNKM